MVQERETFKRLIAGEEGDIKRAEAFKAAEETVGHLRSNAATAAQELEHADREYRRQLEIQLLSERLDQIGAHELMVDVCRMLGGGDIVTGSGLYIGYHEASWDFWVAWGVVKSKIRQSVHKLGRKLTDFELSRIALGIRHRILGGTPEMQFYVRAGTGTATLQEPGMLSSLNPLGPRHRFLTHFGAEGDQILSTTHYSGENLRQLLSGRKENPLSPGSFDLSPRGPALRTMPIDPRQTVSRRSHGPGVEHLLGKGIARVRVQLQR
ncbi:MAG: hypothetical protein HYW63_01285 [Candidatus Levybacteria bacterium]|nr:hypothetical protein [Candidatus Levybacteria bacterium]